MKALFIHDLYDLDAEILGGVQQCSREFLSVVQAAADDVTSLAVTPSGDPLRRLQRRLHLGSYLRYDASALLPRLSDALRRKPTHVFLNRSELLKLAPAIRHIAPESRVVLMSHGNQSGDDLYEVAGPGGSRAHGFARLGATWQLGLDLATEAWHRHRSLDAVCVMSAEEGVIERWLGAKRVIELARLITPDPLPLRPVAKRIGYVGTLDHTPNRVALELLCTEISQCADLDLELRLVGRPSGTGENFARRFSFVRYLGPLDEGALREEAATWSLFVNPVFWLSRGASMKLGQALGWGLPVLTTRSGARGYDFGDTPPPMCGDSPHDFVSRLKQLLTEPALREARVASQLAATAGPARAELARRLHSALILA